MNYCWLDDIVIIRKAKVSNYGVKSLNAENIKILPNIKSLKKKYKKLKRYDELHDWYFKGNITDIELTKF